MRAFKMLSVGAALVCFGVAPGALAQNQGRVDVYHFDDDALIGDTWGSAPPLLRIRSEKLPRAMLIRPRASLVGEMLKSVEIL